MQRPLVQQTNLKESLKYIHPNNPYLVRYKVMYALYVELAFQGELLEAEKQVEKTIKEYRHMLVLFVSTMCDYIGLWALAVVDILLPFSLCVINLSSCL